MKAYGNEQNITPFLDSLTLPNFMLQEIEQCGFRSRNLCFPPTLQSIVKEDNKTNFQREAGNTMVFI
jgi:hypothetical protein